MSGRRLLLVLGGALFLLIIIRTAWLSDTAYVTLRVAENATRGLGLRWNPMERVQATDHPLWMLVLAAAHAVTGEVYFTTLALSIACACAAALLVLAAAPADAGVLVGTAILTLSWSVVEYSTSGLETPLVCLLVAGFARLALARRADTDRTASLLAGLGALAHPFTLFLTAPAALEGIRRQGWRARRTAGWTLAPLAAWTVFATWYYGSPFSNPAVARWVGRGPIRGTLAHGGVWLFESARHDPVAPAVIVAALALAVVADRAARPIALGIALYLSAVMVTGGDAATGRWLAAPAMLGALIVVRQQGLAQARLGASAAAAVVLIAWAGPPLTVTSNATFGDLWPLTVARIVEAQRAGDPVRRTDFASCLPCDQRVRDYPATGLLRDVRQSVPPMGAEGARGREAWRSARRVEVSDRPGFFGYGAGYGVYVIDPAGSADPLLARMRPDPAGQHDVAALGGYVGSADVARRVRRIPEGYAASLPDRPNAIADPDAHARYDRLRTLTRGSLADWRRLPLAFSQLARDLRGRP